MITKEEIEKAVEVCTDGNMDCTQCPLGKRFYRCGVYFALYIKKTSLHCLPTAQARRYQKIPIQHTLMIAHCLTFVKKE